MTFKKFLGLSFVMMFALSTITMTSCSKKEGCTNLQSDNYDSEAEEDDGSCVAWSQKFVGVYGVQLSCTHQVLALALNNPFDMTISRTGDATAFLILETSIGDIPLNATVNQDDLTFEQLTIDTFVNTDLNLVMYNLVVNGSAHYDADTNLSGSINVTADFINLTQSGADDNCGMVATRK